MGQALLKLSPAQERVVIQRAKVNPPSTRSTPMGGDDQQPTNNTKKDTAVEPFDEEDYDVDPEFLMQHEVGSATASQADHTITKVGHYFLIFLFYGVLIAYFVSLVIAYLNQPALDVSTLTSSSNVNPLEVELTTTCLAGTTCGTITINYNYSFLGAGGENNLVRQAACAGGVSAPVAQTMTVANASTTKLNLCYFPDPVFSSVTTGALTGIPGVWISFSAIEEETGWAGIDVRTTAKDGSTYHKFLTVAPGMVKSFHMGLHRQVVDGIETKVLPYSKNYQMDGLRQDGISDVILQLAPYTNLQTVDNERSILRLFADCGSMFELIQLVFAILTPLWALLFAKKEISSSAADRV